MITLINQAITTANPLKNAFSIATGVKFMTCGTQGHNYNQITNYPLDQFDDAFEGYKGPNGKGIRSSATTFGSALKR